MDLFSTADPSGASMVGLGGIFWALTLSFVGPCAIRTIESYMSDRAFISVKGITPDGQLTDINPLEAEVKRAMIRQSERPGFEFLRAEEGEISYSVVSGSYQFAGRKVRA